MFSAVHFYYVLCSSVINVVSFLQLRLQHKRSLLFIAKSISELMDVKESKLLGIQKGQKLPPPHCIDFTSVSLPTCIYCFYLISERRTRFAQWILCDYHPNPNTLLCIPKKFKRKELEARKLSSWPSPLKKTGR